MARKDAQEGRNGGEQVHNPTHGEGLQTGPDRQNPAAHGEKRAETPEEYEKRIDGYAEAIVYFLDHPDAPINPVVRAFIENIRQEMAADESTPVRQTTLN